MKLTIGGGGGEESQTRDSDREGTTNASPRLVPSARIPAPPLLSGLSKVLRGVPRAGREECYCHIHVSSASSCPIHPGEEGALGCWPTKLGTTSFNTRLLGIFVHPAPGTQGAPDGLFGHS